MTGLPARPARPMTCATNRSETAPLASSDRIQDWQRGNSCSAQRRSRSSRAGSGGLEGQLIEHHDPIDAPQRGQHLDPLGGGDDRPAPPLEAADRLVAVDPTTRASPMPRAAWRLRTWPTCGRSKQPFVHTTVRPSPRRARRQASRTSQSTTVGLRNPGRRGGLGRGKRSRWVRGPSFPWGRVRIPGLILAPAPPVGKGQPRAPRELRQPPVTALRRRGRGAAPGLGENRKIWEKKACNGLALTYAEPIWCLFSVPDSRMRFGPCGRVPPTGPLTRRGGRRPGNVAESPP
jgi:hypothetical protein